MYKKVGGVLPMQLGEVALHLASLAPISGLQLQAKCDA